MKKNERQYTIQRMVREQTIRNQAELITLLAQEGIHTTQATLSRDMRELNILKDVDAKGRSSYRIIPPISTSYQVTDEEKLIHALQESSVALHQVAFTNILQVLPGNGQLVGCLLDKFRLVFQEIIGCVAGDDTILIISPSKEAAEKVYQYFQKIIPE